MAHRVVVGLRIIFRGKLFINPFDRGTRGVAFAILRAVLRAPCSYLGTLSHTMTALKALEQRGIKPSAIIINSSETAPVPEQETAETLGRFVPDIPIYIVARNAETLPEELVLTL